MGFDGLTNLLPNAALPSLKDLAFAAGWNDVPDIAPSQNVAYSEIAILDLALGFAVGSYTPVQSTVTNANTFVFNPSTYWRIANSVFVIGWMRFTPPAGGVSVFDISLPIDSNFTQTWHCSGVGGNGVQATSFGVSISANVTTKKCQFFCKPSQAAVTTNTNGYMFQYLVLP